ncbi:catalysis At the Interface: the anatomy of A conformational change in A triglyceride lipase [Phascolomyces articulosus]|uniref:Catalysis At the Interface: the anatomy of A conformational change in A triglyceride lipase n=1 Tax=Phascolomyces articulosus TaxID=60185 RepID=A0AAD5K502_9FUNG|nr:catalysis At the Interface: the anatomy of A conformational change in A triglyceride lipase [Phascolomyces articulosus]
MNSTISFTIFLLYLFSLLSSALPSGTYNKGDTRIATTDEIKELAFYSSLSADVYCSSVINNKKFDCPYCDKAKHLKVVDAFTTTTYDTNALIARGDAEKTIYIVFRGSQSVRNWVADFTAVPVNYHNVPRAKVHLGFLQSYREVEKQLVATVSRQLQAHPGYTVAVDGHSLGGSVALLCALDLYEKGVKNIKLYTQGQPRVGNKAFAEYVTKTGIPYKRVVHENDPVPHFPNNNIVFEFYHAGEEFWDTHNLVVVCPNGLESKYCSSSLIVGLNPLDHVFYFGMSTGVCIDSKKIIEGLPFSLVPTVTKFI